MTEQRPYTVEKVVEGTYRLTRKCPECGRATVTHVESQSLWDYEHQNIHVQRAFPYMSPEEREAIFMTGICGPCWDRLFPEEDE